MPNDNIVLNNIFDENVQAEILFRNIHSFSLGGELRLHSILASNIFGYETMLCILFHNTDIFFGVAYPLLCLCVYLTLLYI